MCPYSVGFLQQYENVDHCILLLLNLSARTTSTHKVCLDTPNEGLFLEKTIGRQQREVVMLNSELNSSSLVEEVFVLHKNPWMRSLKVERMKLLDLTSRREQFLSH